MTPRSIRRAAERKQLKLARKEARATETSPVESATAHQSTGPKTDEGKAVSSLNNLRHGLTGQFRVLQSENRADYDHVLNSLREEHNPETPTEEILVTKMAEHHWLSRRAQRMQDNAMYESDQKSFMLYVRYQTTNDRAFSRCLNDLLKLRKQRHQFESQNAQLAATEATTRLKNAQAALVEFRTQTESTCQAPIPGYAGIPYADVRELFTTAMIKVNDLMQEKAA